jgi:hypothetical protein
MLNKVEIFERWVGEVVEIDKLIYQLVKVVERTSMKSIIHQMDVLVRDQGEILRNMSL